jgi:hypothetical protein
MHGCGQETITVMTNGGRWIAAMQWHLQEKGKHDSKVDNTRRRRAAAAMSVAWPQLGTCGLKVRRHKHNKGRKLQPFKCSRFHLGKTSNRWWA